jgi:HSP20 family protein
MALLKWYPASSTLDRWDPFRDVTEIQNEMNRLFEGYFGRPGRTAQAAERFWSPAVDMYETKDELVLAVELPGLSEKDIRLTVDGDTLVVRGERMRSGEVKEDGFYRAERWFGKFERALSLPMPVQADKIVATYREGVLTVKLPKVEAVKPKEIKIEAQ